MTDRAASPKTRKAGRKALAAVLALMLLAGAGVLAWQWFAEPDLPPFQPHASVPRDADAVAWLDGLGPAVRGLQRLAARVGGADGVLEAVQLTVGVDLRDAEAVGRAGLRPDAGAVAFQWRGAAWLALPVRGEHGARHVGKILERRGYLVTELEPAPGGNAVRRWAIGSRNQDKTTPAKEMARLWLDGSTLLVRAPGQVVAKGTALPPIEDPETARKAWLAAPRFEALPASHGELHVRAPLAANGEWNSRLHAALGPGNLLLGGLIDKLQRAELDLTLDAANPHLRLALRTAPGVAVDIANYHAGFLPGDVDAQPGTAGLLDLGTLLPDETPLLVRGRLNLKALQAFPVALRDRVLPATLLAFLHPALSGVDARTALLAELDGQWAAGVLAVGDDVPLDARAWPTLSWRTALRAFAAVSMRTDLAAEHLLNRVQSALATTADVPVPVQLGRWSGFSVPGPEAPWLLLRDGRRVALVAGLGGQDDLQRIAAGKFPSLGAHVRDDIEADVTQGRHAWLGALVTTPRLARSLRRRGVPDHFVQMLTSITAVAATVRLGPDGVDIALQLRPAEETGASAGPPAAPASTSPAAASPTAARGAP